MVSMRRLEWLSRGWSTEFNEAAVLVVRVQLWRRRWLVMINIDWLLLPELLLYLSSTNNLLWKIMMLNGKENSLYMAIIHSYFDITRWYWMVCFHCAALGQRRAVGAGWDDEGWGISFLQAFHISKLSQRHYEKIGIGWFYSMTWKLSVERLQTCSIRNVFICYASPALQ